MFIKSFQHRERDVSWDQPLPLPRLTLAEPTPCFCVLFLGLLWAQQELRHTGGSRVASRAVLAPGGCPVQLWPTGDVADTGRHAEPWVLAWGSMEGTPLPQQGLQVSPWLFFTCWWVLLCSASASLAFSSLLFSPFLSSIPCGPKATATPTLIQDRGTCEACTDTKQQQAQNSSCLLMFLSSSCENIRVGKH